MSNEDNFPLGELLPYWSAPLFPSHSVLDGAFCRVEPLDAGVHGEQLFQAFQRDEANNNWLYLPYGPFADKRTFLDWLDSVATKSDPQFYAFIDNQTQKAIGMGSYLRIDPDAGSIEVGHLNFSPLMQRRPMATEAMFLLMKKAFELGYRRYEWKCNSLNAASIKAAKRLGFTYEGTFRQARVDKGRNRDTAWFSIIDSEWPGLKVAFERWLAVDNFDNHGHQLKSLKEFRP